MLYFLLKVTTEKTTDYKTFAENNNNNNKIMIMIIIIINNSLICIIDMYFVLSNFELTLSNLFKTKLF